MYQAVGIGGQRGRVRHGSERSDTKQILAFDICGEDSTSVFRGLEGYQVFPCRSQQGSRVGSGRPPLNGLDKCSHSKIGIKPPRSLRDGVSATAETLAGSDV
jgi:hypothetical protein